MRHLEAVPSDGASIDPLVDRVRELETLCAQVYVAAVELGLPQTLLNRLWTVAARGGTPQAYQVDMPPRVVHARARRTPTTESAPRRSTPDFSADRPKPNELRGRLPELQPLPQRRTVLVVDDDPMMLEVLVRILQRENYAILTAGSGSAALKAASQQEGAIDLLVTDFAMPDMHGRELAERMRDRYAGIKVLYQTGFSDLLFENRVELEDASAFVEKPFTARGLREAARFVLFGALNPAA